MEIIYLVVIFVMAMITLASTRLGGWLIPMVLGMFSIAFCAASLEYSANIPFHPYPQLLLGITGALVCLYSATNWHD